MLAISSVALFASVLALFALAIGVALLINVARNYRVRVQCYRRHGVASLVKAAKRNAIKRYMPIVLSGDTVKRPLVITATDARLARMAREGRAIVDRSADAVVNAPSIMELAGF